jgi:hypothetical protein
MQSLFTVPVFFQNLSSALNVLTAMLTPALLLSATGSFIISTSNRLGRVVDRVRKLSDRMEDLMNRRAEMSVELLEERQLMVAKHMRLQSHRASLLMKTLVALYISSGLFVLTSVSIGFVSIFSPKGSVIPVAFGVLGAVSLMVATVRLITEARLALDGLQDEMDFLQKLSAVHVKKGQMLDF